ncbi:hypothetical protein BpHYR1_046592 [Brachionus plicatilis]|uniref:Uncharacterized protein n=1 Tax=Brachionus plicatilis TaxID=10195 RepID=A0A3M7S3C8_BRAPC|nr:hypothetical protein BpHYR1_046592 [Brachionus plicatilis]
MNIPLERKRRPGRPKATANALTRQPNETQNVNDLGISVYEESDSDDPPPIKQNKTELQGCIGCEGCNLYNKLIINIKSAYIQASKFAFFIRIEAGDDVNFFEYKRPAYIQNPLIFGEIRSPVLASINKVFITSTGIVISVAIKPAHILAKKLIDQQLLKHHVQPICENLCIMS